MQVLLEGTPVEDRQTDLLKIARLDPEEQVRVAQAISDGQATTYQRAWKLLAHLPTKGRGRVVARIGDLTDDPRPGDVKKLQGQIDQYRIRVGTYRVVYRISDDPPVVTVLRVGHRKDVYDP